VNMSELKERNILKLILIVRFTCATLDVGHPIRTDSELITDNAFTVSPWSIQKVFRFATWFCNSQNVRERNIHTALPTNFFREFYL
jgi:hypothetical protein